MTREETLDTAKKMVCGHREQDYGTPENNFQAIADLWNAYLKHAYNSTPLPGFTAFDVAILMTLLKVGRIATGTATDDSFVDACGYLACGAEINNHAKESLKEMIEFNKTSIKSENAVNLDDRCPGSGAKLY